MKDDARYCLLDYVKRIVCLGACLLTLYLSFNGRILAGIDYGVIGRIALAVVATWLAYIAFNWVIKDYYDTKNKRS